MKPKGGLKCSRRLHSLRLKRLESRKRVRLGRKRFWSQSDLEAFTFTESGQACMQEGGCQAGEARGAVAQGWGCGRGTKGPQSMEGTPPLPPPSCSQAHCGPEVSQGAGSSWR